MSVTQSMFGVGNAKGTKIKNINVALALPQKIPTCQALALFLLAGLKLELRIPARAGYSGLIECPCSERLEIEWRMAYAIDPSDSSCKSKIQNATESWSAHAVVCLLLLFTYNNCIRLQ